MNDIRNKDDVRMLVHAFYKEVQKDPIIGSVFHARISKEQWPHHLERMVAFWNTVLFAQAEYRGNPFSKHQSLPIEKIHFERWMMLFTRTLDTLFTGPKKEEAKERAQKMATLFQSKLAYLKNNPKYKTIV